MSNDRKTYFFVGNLKNKVRKDPKKKITYSSTEKCDDYKFICPCANSYSSQTGEAEFFCYCDGSMAIGWPEIRQELIKKGLKEDYISEV